MDLYVSGEPGPTAESLGGPVSSSSVSTETLAPASVDAVLQDESTAGQAVVLSNFDPNDALQQQADAMVDHLANQLPAGISAFPSENPADRATGGGSAGLSADIALLAGAASAASAQPPRRSPSRLLPTPARVAWRRLGRVGQRHRPEQRLAPARDTCRRAGVRQSDSVEPASVWICGPGGPTASTVEIYANVTDTWEMRPGEELLVTSQWATYTVTRSGLADQAITVNLAFSDEAGTDLLSDGLPAQFALFEDVEIDNGDGTFTPAEIATGNYVLMPAGVSSVTGEIQATYDNMVSTPAGDPRSLIVSIAPGGDCQVGQNSSQAFWIHDTTGWGDSGINPGTPGIIINPKPYPFEVYTHVHPDPPTSGTDHIVVFIMGGSSVSKDESGQFVCERDTWT